MKVDIDDVELSISKHQIDQVVAKQILNDIRRATQEAKADGGGGGKKPKYKHLIIASDPEGKFKDIENIPMWVVKMNEEENHTEFFDKFFEAAYDYNAEANQAQSRKGRGRKSKKIPVKTVGEAMQYIPAKFLKTKDLKTLTKEPVIILKTDNKIPTDEKEKAKDDNS